MKKQSCSTSVKLKKTKLILAPGSDIENILYGFYYKYAHDDQQLYYFRGTAECNRLITL